MPPTTCRRFVATFLQCKIEADQSDDREGRARQDLKHFIADQMLVLYGFKKLAEHNIVHFAYGLRKYRYRKTMCGGREREPVLYTFWQMAQLGVPEDQTIDREELDFLLLILQELEAAMQRFHMSKSVFWKAFAAADLYLPVVALQAALRRCFAQTSPMMYRRAVELISARTRNEAAQVAELLAKNKPDEGRKGRRMSIGSDGTAVPKQIVAGDNKGGHMSLDGFVQDCFEARRDESEKIQSQTEAMCISWGAAGGSFEPFSEMLLFAENGISERTALEIFRGAFDATEDAPDSLNIKKLIVLLRDFGVELKPQPVEQFTTPPAALNGEPQQVAGRLHEWRSSGQGAALWQRAAQQRVQKKEPALHGLMRQLLALQGQDNALQGQDSETEAALSDSATNFGGFKVSDLF